MAAVYQQKACCWFYRSGSGTSQAGGCTKSFLDAHHGNLSQVMGANGEPKQAATVLLVNDFATQTAQLTAAGLETDVLTGLVARVYNTFAEVIDVGPDTVVLEGWVGQGYAPFIFVTTNGINSRVYTGNPALYTTERAMHVKGTTGGVADGTYAVVSNDGFFVEINDGMAVFNVRDSPSMSVAPDAIPDLSVSIGGAYNDLQDVLDLSDAAYHDQWIFLNEEIAPSVVDNGAAYTLYSTNDGEAANNTKLYIVGYQSDAYDCLPAGLGYVPEGTQHVGTYYKTALQRAKNLSDAAIKADLPTASCKNLPGSTDPLFCLYTNAENIQFMGIYFEIAAARWAILADNESTGSVFVKHCAGGHVSYDGAPDYYGGQIIRVNDSATGGGIVDSFFKGVEMFNGTPPAIDRSGDWEFAYNVGIHTNNINPEYTGPIIHHNIFVKSQWGASVVTRSFQNVFNNIFYLCRRAGFNLNGTEGRLRAWNNIIVMEDTDPLFLGLFYVGAGGTVDFFDYNCYCNRNGQPVVFKSDSGTNPDFNFDNLKKGLHDIEADPMLMDPANWDFRLRENSPCLAAGRPDLQGNPTTIGPSLEKQTVGLYGKNKNLYGI